MRAIISVGSGKGDMHKTSSCAELDASPISLTFSNAVGDGSKYVLDVDCCNRLVHAINNLVGTE